MAGFVGAEPDLRGHLLHQRRPDVCRQVVADPGIRDEARSRDLLQQRLRPAGAHDRIVLAVDDQGGCGDPADVDLQPGRPTGGQLAALRGRVEGAAVVAAFRDLPGPRLVEAAVGNATGPEDVHEALDLSLAVAGVPAAAHREQRAEPDVPQGGEAARGRHGHEGGQAAHPLRVPTASIWPIALPIERRRRARSSSRARP